MNKTALVSVSLIIVVCTPAFCVDAIAISEPRPLGKLAVELQRRYGYLVTYEEAPFDSERERSTEILKNGTRYHSPVWKPIVFYVPDGLPETNANAAEDSVTHARAKYPNPDIMESLVREYNESGVPESLP